MRTAVFGAAMAAVLMLAGCGGKQAAPPQAPASADGQKPLNWAYAPKALELTFVSDPFLNEHEGAAHSLSVCVYQLQDPSSFKALAATPPGASRLLDCGDFDPASVVSVQRVTVRPGRNEVVTLDRGGKARFVAIACGFYDLNPGTATQVYEIPVSSDTSGWLWWKETTYHPAKLSRKILLGRTGLQGD